MRSFRQLVEMSFPTGFSISDFIKLKSLKEMLNYADEVMSYAVLGIGSSRIVYWLDGSTVLKIATCDAGVAQNRAENRTPESGRKFKDLFAKVHMIDPKGRWLIMERVFKLVDSNQFKYYFGVDSRDMTYIMNNPHMFNTDKFKEPLKLLVEYVHFSMGDLIPGDVCKSGAWGIVERNGKEIPVLIDYGFTRYVSKEHY